MNNILGPSIVLKSFVQIINLQMEIWVYFRLIVLSILINPLYKHKETRKINFNTVIIYNTECIGSIIIYFFNI